MHKTHRAQDPTRLNGPDVSRRLAEARADLADIDQARRDLMPLPAYYIDTVAGVIGDASQLVFLDFVPNGMDEEPDSTIINYGQDHGVPLDRLI